MYPEFLPEFQKVVRRLVGVLLVALLAGVAPAWAQGDAAVRGQVVTAATDVALVSIGVTLKSASSGVAVQTSTDEDGRFSFQQLRPGEYTLSSAAEGFATSEMRFVLEPREVKLITVELEVGGVALSVDVTGELARSESTHSPSSTVVKSELIESRPVALRANLADLLVTAAPGMVRGDSDFVHVRGHEIGLSFLINGVAFWENPLPAYSGGLSPDIIETANVMTGGFSAEYGNRFGGVVDVVTKSGFTVRHSGTATVNVGELDRRSVSGEFGSHGERFGYFVFGSVFDSDRFQNPPDTETIHDEGRTAHSFFQLDGNFGSKGSLRAVVMADATTFQIPKTRLDEELRPLANADQRTRQQTAIVGWTRAANDTAVSGSFYQRWSRLLLNPAGGPLTASASLDREVLTLGGKLDVTRFSGRHAIKAGVDLVGVRPQEELIYSYAGYADLLELIGEEALTFDGQVRFAGRESGGEFSAYVQDSVQLGTRLTADVGLRLDKYGMIVSATHVSPRVNLSFLVGNHAIVHASYNNFFGPPAIEGVLSTSAGLTEHIEEIGVALPPLEPTTEHQFEVGGSSAAGPLRLALTGYYRSSENAVHTTVWPDSRIYSHASFGKVKAYGLEAKAEMPLLAPYGLTGYLNYALGRIYYYNPVIGGFVTEAEHIEETNRFLAPMDQKHTLTGGLSYFEPRTGVTMGTAVEYGSGTPMEVEAGPSDDEEAVRVPGHFTADLFFGVDVIRQRGRRPKLSLRVDVQNITDNVYLIAQESAEFSPALYSIPRVFSVTAKLQF